MPSPQRTSAHLYGCDHLHVAERLVLREVAPGDDDELVGWFPDAAALRRFAGDTLSWPLTGAQLQALRADPRNHAWTAWTTGPAVRRVGHAELVRIDDARVLLARVGVAPPDRGRGLGTALLGEVIEKAHLLKVIRLELNVYADNRSAVQLYRSAGFQDQPPLAGRPEVLRTARSLG